MQINKRPLEYYENFLENDTLVHHLSIEDFPVDLSSSVLSKEEIHLESVFDDHLNKKNMRCIQDMNIND